MTFFFGSGQNAVLNYVLKKNKKLLLTCTGTSKKNLNIVENFIFFPNLIQKVEL